MSKQVIIKLSVSPQLAKWIDEKGEASGIKPRATSATSLLKRLALIDNNPNLQAVLNVEGGTFIGLLEKMVKEGLKRRGYSDQK